jgi:hypothetical protein
VDLGLERLRRQEGLKILVEMESKSMHAGRGVDA